MDSSLRLRLAMERLGLRTLVPEQAQQQQQQDGSPSSCLSSSLDAWSSSSSSSPPQEAPTTAVGSLDRTIDRMRFQEEEAALEEMIVELIVSGKWEVLQPNSGNAVTIGNHHVCISCSAGEEAAGYRTWEWHGHIMVYDEQQGCTPEYVYGNFFEELDSEDCSRNSSSSSNSSSNFAGHFLKPSLGFYSGIPV